MDRALISKLLEVDPEFPEFFATLHGISKMDDPSENHVATSTQKQQKKKNALAGGLLLGTAAEGTATTRAFQTAAQAVKKPQASVAKPKAAGRLRGTLRRVGESRGGKVGEAVLQGTNLAIGLGAAHELLTSNKKQKVSKSVGHFQPIGNVQANARARAAGLRLPGATAGHPAGRRGLTPVKVPVAKNALEAELPETEWVGEIAKFNVDKRQVFGWASLSMVDGEPVLDRQGDYIDIMEAEDAAYHYMLNSRKGGDMHRRIAKAGDSPVHTADVIESMVFTPEKIEALGLEKDALPLGWWLGMQVHDPQQWDDIKTGKRTGFSVHGTGTRKDMVLT